ncbi:sugar kinase [Streptomyces albipurpureus]|uniref:Sugar kinase n=1 Tax=Streptomyces albipurpureus TaxID=2897419 RepID=A0ABT0UL47_9ACTN|nr:sugar kinase [Streptomyces sp. CWNU-1]MCM2389190.1 sugar kinase [Streptomyces sp. CWNU-1]
MTSPTGTATVATTDVICLGESMVTFLPSRPGRLADVPSFARAIGGAESNVACALAAIGHRVRWVSRVGVDGFGDHLIEAIAAYGVDTSAVSRDPRRPTGIYFRTATDRSAATHEVVYYRAGSAASAMSPKTVPYADVTSARVLHLSGITAALSADCLALMHELTAPRAGRPLVSFDINHRPGLWRDASGARVLLELARGADLVFVGEDEAEAAWGLRGAEAIREALPEPAMLVVKQGGRGAIVFAAEGDGDDRVPARTTTADQAPEDQTSPGTLAVGAGSDRPRGTTDAPAADATATASGNTALGGMTSRTDQAAEPRPAAPASPDGGTPPAPRPDTGRDGTAAETVLLAPSSTRHSRAFGAGHASSRPLGSIGGRSDTVTFVPAPKVEIIAAVGAGDAFAAGFLSGTLRGLPIKERIRHGHLLAAAALTVPGDVGQPPATAHADRLAALDDAGWERLRLGPGWTSAVHEEVRTP